MSATPKAPRRRSQRRSLRPSDGSAGAPRPLTRLGTVAVDGRPYEWLGRDGASFVAVDPIVAGPDTEPIPGRLLPFAGYPVTADVMVRQTNRVVEVDGRSVVLGMTRYSISLDGVLVYSPPIPSPGAASALAEAQHALGRLLAHPVRWADEAAWRDRNVYYLDVPAIVRAFYPARGEVLLQVEPSEAFPPTVASSEAAVDPDDVPEPTGLAVVDILSDRVHWHRRSDGAGTSTAATGDESYG